MTPRIINDWKGPKAIARPTLRSDVKAAQRCAVDAEAAAEAGADGGDAADAAA